MAFRIKLGGPWGPGRAFPGVGTPIFRGFQVNGHGYCSTRFRISAGDLLFTREIGQGGLLSNSSILLWDPFTFFPQVLGGIYSRETTERTRAYSPGI